MPYIRERINRDGSVRHYWIRPGFKIIALPADEDERNIKAMRLNQDAKKGLRRAVAHIRPEDNPLLFSYWIERYQKAEAFGELAKSSKESYRIACRRLSDILGEAPIEGITARIIRRYLTAHESSIQLKHRARAVIRNIMSLCIDEGVIESNPVRDVKLKTPPKRKAIYSDEDIELNLMGIDREPLELRHWLRMGFFLELYSGQRIGDCLVMQWSSDDGEYINVTQEKGGKELSIYCHSALRAELNEAKRMRKGVNIVQRGDGRPVRYQVFRRHMKRVRDSVGIGHLTNHDLRRTAATKLAEAGNTIPVIAAVTGHSERTIQTLCEVYIQKTRRMSKAAILNLEKFQRGECERDVERSGERGG